MDHIKNLSEESVSRFLKIRNKPEKLEDDEELRATLLDFIADFSIWENSSDQLYLSTAQDLTSSAYESLGANEGPNPIVLDPFCGGGAIPIEALRIGADCFASDINPVAVILNKVLLEYIPEFGVLLSREVQRLGQAVKSAVNAKVDKYYPSDQDGFTPIAYLWARTIKCHGPSCGAEFPMMNQMWIKKKGNPSWAYQFDLDRDKKIVAMDLVENPSPIVVQEGTSTQGAATCPLCGFTTSAKQVRALGVDGKIGRRICAVVLGDPETSVRRFRLPTPQEFELAKEAERVIEANEITGDFLRHSAEPIPTTELRRISVPLYGITRFSELFLPRQLLTLSCFEQEIRKCRDDNIEGASDESLRQAALDVITVAVSSMLHYNTNLSTYLSNGMISAFIQGTSLAMRSDFAEANPLMPKLVGGFDFAIKNICDVIENLSIEWKSKANVGHNSATNTNLPDDSVSLVATDPPYYDSIPYAHLSDVFYIWMRSVLRGRFPQIFNSEVIKKQEEIVEDRPHSKSPSKKGKDFFERSMTEAMAETRRVIGPGNLQIIVFAHKSTSGWEAMLNSLLASGWVVTAAWPIDTERPARMNAYQNASLLSSIHIVCRPREIEEVGDWRQVLEDLPKRIHDWMPHLADQGVVGADAIFACLGPALEIFSRYSSVEKASGEQVALKEYLEEVWAAVSFEALNMIFEGADASGFEEDARLTAMWLWTLRTKANGDNESGDDAEEAKSIYGYSLEYDAARKIAQGLGAHLEPLSHLVEIKGGTATLLSAGARINYLFGKDAEEAPMNKRKKKDQQMKLDLDGELHQLQDESGATTGEFTVKAGSTVLDQLHQAMILFGGGRREAVRRLLVEDGIGSNQLFWRLAQALTALYPPNTEEKRWVDGVLARKKGLGF